MHINRSQRQLGNQATLRGFVPTYSTPLNPKKTCTGLPMILVEFASGFKPTLP